jgi:hypothetical protein
MAQTGSESQFRNRKLRNLYLETGRDYLLIDLLSFSILLPVERISEPGSSKKRW